jgi:NADH dehydrogenase
MAKVVVLGAGYAGLQAAREAARAPEASVILVDRSLHHQLVTEMHRVASAEVDPAEVTFPVQRLVGREVDFRRAEVVSIHPSERRVQTSQGALAYDLLVLALGSAAEYYGVPGADRHALTLQYLDSALRIKNRLNQLIRRGEAVEVVVVGGGLTGVELASALADHLRERRCRDWRIVLLQAAPTVLPEETEELIRYAEESLVAEGVVVREGTPVARVEPDAVVLDSGERVPASLIIWTGGVRANPIPGEAGLPTDRRGRVLVDERLRVEGHPEVFACGDVALVKSPDSGQPLPPTAQLAIQTGRAVGRNIGLLLAGEALRPFRPRILGTVASIGRRRGIAHLGRFRLKGRVALTLKRLALLRYLYEVGGLAVGAGEPLLLRWWTQHPQSVEEVQDRSPTLPAP